MNEDMSDIMSKFNDMMNNGTVPDNIKEALNNLKNTNSTSSSTDSNPIKDRSNNGAENNASNNTNTSGINPEMINNIMNMFNSSQKSNSNNSNNSSSNSNNSNSTPNIDIEMMMKMKTIMDKMNSNKDDPRSNLLLSLKPYLKESRKDKVEQYIKIFNMSKVIDVLKPDGGDKKNDV